MVKPIESSDSKSLKWEDFDETTVTAKGKKLMYLVESKKEVGGMGRTGYTLYVEHPTFMGRMTFGPCWSEESCFRHAHRLEELTS